MCSDYHSKLAISWLLYRDDVSLCPRVHQVGFLLLYLVKPKLTAGLVGVLLDLTKGLGLVLMRVNPVWFIAGLSKKINGSPFESKSFIALCTYVSSLWIYFLPLSLFSPCLKFSLPSLSLYIYKKISICFYFLLFQPLPFSAEPVAAICPCECHYAKLLERLPLFLLGRLNPKPGSGSDHNWNKTPLLPLLFCLHPNYF